MACSTNYTSTPGGVDLYVVFDSDPAKRAKMENNGIAIAGNLKENADFIAGDYHFSLWYTPADAASHTLQLYVVPAGQPFAIATALLVDTIVLERKTNPELLVLTDFRNLFLEFLETDIVAASADSNNNGIRDYYEAVDRLREYARNHQGIVLDVLQDAYSTAYDYYADLDTRRKMTQDIDQMLSKLPAGMRTGLSAVRNIAIIGDDAVVPFYRVPVPTSLKEETDYDRDALDAQGAKYPAIRTTSAPTSKNPTILDVIAKDYDHFPGGHWMSDVPYGTFDATPPAKPVFEYDSPPPVRPRLDVGLGRIFRDQPLQLVELIDAFEQPLRLYRDTTRTFVMNACNDSGSYGIEFVRPTRASLVEPAIKYYGGCYLRLDKLKDSVGDYQMGLHWVNGEINRWDGTDIYQKVKGQAHLLMTLSHTAHFDLYNNGRWFREKVLGNSLGVPATYKLLVLGGCHGGLNIARYKGEQFKWDSMLCREALSVNAAMFGVTAYDFGNDKPPSYNYYHDERRSFFLESLFFSPWVYTLGGVLRESHNLYQLRVKTFSRPDICYGVLYNCVLYGLPTQTMMRGESPKAKGSNMEVRLVKAADARGSSTAERGRVAAPRASSSRSPTPQSFNGTLSIPYFEVTQNGQGRVTFAVPHNGSLDGIEFEPVLPVVHHTYLLPADAAGISVAVTSNVSRPYGQPVTMAPMVPVSKSHGPLSGSANITKPYPEFVLSYATLSDSSGVHLDVQLVPLQYNPDTRQVTLYDRIDYRVSYNGSAAVSIRNIAINSGNPLGIDQTNVPVDVTVETTDNLSGALRWEIRDAAGALVDTSYGSANLTAGTSQLTFRIDTVGWEPGAMQLPVQLYNAYSENATGQIVASGHRLFTVAGASLEISTNATAYRPGDRAAISAVVRNETGATVPGVSGNFTQQLDGAGINLAWSGAGSYNATLELGAIASGQHTLTVSARGRTTQTGFVIDGTPPTSTVNGTAEVYSPYFTVAISGSDNLTGVAKYFVQYRVSENGTWTDWLTRATDYDYSHTGQDDLEPLFGPNGPVKVTAGTTYYFRVRAMDHAGNLEAEHSQPDHATRYVATKVVINEVYPNPAAGEGEWIELYNSSPADINLTGWKIQNASGRLDYTIPASAAGWDGILKAGSYLVLHIGETTDTPGKDLYADNVSGVLDDESDTIRLLSANGIAVDFVRYGGSLDWPGAGTFWSGVNPDTPARGQSLGRDATSKDREDGSDWENTGGVDASKPTPGMGNGSQPSGCFIATAAYGTSSNRNLRALRAFRDNVLAKTPPGRAFVEVYYAASPPIAEALAQNEGLRTATTLLLVTPVSFLASVFSWLASFVILGILLAALGILAIRHRTARAVLKSLGLTAGIITILTGLVFALGYFSRTWSGAGDIGAWILPFILVLPIAIGALHLFAPLLRRRGADEFPT